MNVPRDNTAAMEQSEQIQASLRALRRRGWLLTVVSGVSWAGVVWILVATGFVTALGWWGGDLLRTAGWALLALGGLAVIVSGILVPLRRIYSLDSVARRVGEQVPDFASSVLSASQFTVGVERTPFSSSLLEGHLGDVARRLESIPGKAVFPGRSLVIPVLALALSIGAALGVGEFAPGVVRAGLDSIWAEPRVPEFEVEEIVARSPVVGDLTITLHYPDYLDRQARKLNDVSGGIVAPLGTTAFLEGRILEEGMDRGGIKLPGGKVSPLNVRANGGVTSKFVVKGAGSFSVTLGDEKRRFEGPARNLEIEEDSPPMVRLLRPANDVVVDESGEVILEFEAMDDHGITRIDLVVRSADGERVRTSVMRAGDEIRRLKSRHRWVPSNIRIGDKARVDLELEVFDNDTISGPKPGRSRTLKAQVMTRLSRHESVLKEQERALDGLIDLLASRLDSKIPSAKRKEETKERFTVLRSRTEDVLGRTARLIHEIHQDPLTPRSVEEAFLQIREDLSAQLIHEARLHRPPMAGFSKRQGVDRVTVRLIENAVVRVDDLILDQQFAGLVVDGDRLMEGREELAGLVEAYGRNRAEKSRRDLLAAIERMEKAVAGLTSSLEGVRGKVGDTFLNPSSVQVIDLSGALQRIRAMIAADDIAGAMALAAQLEEMVARLMTGLESGHLSFRTERFGEGEKFIGDLLDRLMAIESDQLQLRRQTIGLRRRYQEKLLEVMKGRIDPLVSKQLKRVGQLSKRLAKAENPSGEETRVGLVRSRVAVRELELALGQGDLDEAQRLAQDIQSTAGQLARDGEGGQDLVVEFAHVERVARELETEIGEAFPKPALLFGERDKRDTRNQTARQRHLNFRTKRLRTWIKKQGDETRFLTHQALESLHHVAGKMGDGVSHLESRRLREALEAQTEALDELERLRQDLRRGNETAQLESRPIVLKGEVDIPDPGEYEVPAEHRDDILEAMRGDLPSNYREAIERYYETLVR